VVGREQGDDFVLGRLSGFHPILASQLQGGFDRLGATGEEVDLFQVAWSERGEFPRELFYRLTGEGGAVQIGNLRGLLRHGRTDLPDPVTDVGDEGPTGPVEIALPVFVDQPAAFSPGDEGKPPGELPVEDGRIGILVESHWGEKSDPLPVDYLGGLTSVAACT
jgi:hypothetical protein